MRVKNRFRNISVTAPRSQTTIILVWIAVCAAILLVSTVFVRQLRAKEQYFISLWSYAMSRLGNFDEDDPLIEMIINERNTIPFVITDERLNPEHYHLVPSKIIDNPKLLRKYIDYLTGVNPPISINMWDGSRHYVFYDQSQVLKNLTYFPLIQVLIFATLMVLGMSVFRTTKINEQNNVWVGLAKETAHQLGTPTSSLLGWLEYLRSQPIDQSAVEEINKDLTHLTKIVDRFSKIGSQTELSPASVNEAVGESVIYFRSRIPKNVTLSYNGLAMAPVRAMLNSALFEWVVENLLKNALDALQGRGAIDVNISFDNEKVYIDVRDNGKGIAKSNIKKIFEPGFTTKTRGWGLGLSLSRRVIEDYHNGKIMVLDSELGKGTTIRIILKRIFE